MTVLFTSMLLIENFYYLKSQFIIYMQKVKAHCKILRYYRKESSLYLAWS